MASVLKAEGRKLLKLRRDEEEKRKAHKQAADKLAQQQRRVHEHLENEGFKTTTIDLGKPYGEVQLGAREKVFARVFDKDALREWAEENGRAQEAVKFDFNKAPLNELVRESLETGQPLPQGLDFSRTPYVQVTIKKKKG